MGLFNKIKNMFHKNTELKEEQIIETEINELEEKFEKVYEKESFRNFTNKHRRKTHS